MSDLTRRVLDAHQTITDATACDWTEIDRARDTLEDAAPILARQIEAVEALEADLLGAATVVRTQGFTERADAFHRIADRIRDALDGDTP